MYAYGRISIHAPRTGSDAYLCTPHGEEGNFNPRSPHGERQGAVRAAAEWRYFNPRSPHGERLCNVTNTIYIFQFQSTLPARGATRASRSCPLCRGFQSTLPARGATIFVCSMADLFGISIHAPRTGSDDMDVGLGSFGSDISIHAPRTGSDRLRRWLCNQTTSFQSTLPARGATTPKPRRCVRTDDFNPRSPHGERHNRRREEGKEESISIHAPRTGSDG